MSGEAARIALQGLNQPNITGSAGRVGKRMIEVLADKQQLAPRIPKDKVHLRRR